jgi:hypothetical protein
MVMHIPVLWNMSTQLEDVGSNLLWNMCTYIPISIYTTEDWNLKKKYGHFLWLWQHKSNTIRWMWITTGKSGLAKWYNATLCTLLLDLTYGSEFVTAIRMLLHMCYTLWTLATVSSFYLASNDRFTNSNAPLRHTWWQKQTHF